MIKALISLAILLTSIHAGAQVRIKNDTMFTVGNVTQYEILRAFANYHKLQLELKSPRNAYNRAYIMRISIKSLPTSLKIFRGCTGMKYLVKDNKLMVGWAKGRY